ncbi:MAG: hypothetical protein HQL11_04445, partial [Candidatus Omnitrophica bacterium]|nr:hypothetical protein [Candidatus Omnitrophota bacterium]
FIYEQAASLDLGLVLPETQLVFAEEGGSSNLLDVYDNVVQLAGQDFKRSFSRNREEVRLRALDGSQDIVLELSELPGRIEVRGRAYTVRSQHRDLMDESSKIKWLDGLVEREAADNGKVLALVDFRKAVRRLALRYSKRYGQDFGLGVWGGNTQQGGMTLEERNRRIWRFRSEDRPGVLSGTFGLLASSINLFQTPGSPHHNSVLARMTRPWKNLFDADRLLGYGQTHQVRAYTPVSEFGGADMETVGEMIQERLAEERALFDHVIDGAPILDEDSQQAFESYAQRMMRAEAPAGARLVEKASLLPDGLAFDDVLPENQLPAAALGLGSSEGGRLTRILRGGKGSVPVRVSMGRKSFAAVVETGQKGDAVLRSGDARQNIVVEPEAFTPHGGPGRVLDGTDALEFKSMIMNEVRRMIRFADSQADQTCRIALVDSPGIPESCRLLMDEITRRFADTRNVIIKSGSADSIRSWIADELKPSDRDSLVVFGWHETLARYFPHPDLMKAAVGMEADDHEADRWYWDAPVMMHLLLAMALKDEPRIKSLYERLTGNALKSMDDLRGGKLVIYPKLQRLLVDLDRLHQLASEALRSA